MTSTEFEKIVHARFGKCIDLMFGEKDQEYSRNNDKLYNFKRAGEILRCTPEKALLGMLSKHLVSIIDIVEDIEKGRIPNQKILDEKCGDIINYIVLLQAILEEEYFSIDKR